MLFNSIEFALFLVVVFGLYWFVLNRNLKAQNLFLITASYFFYGWWDWRFLSLIVISSSVDYFAGRMMARKQSARRKLLLFLSIAVNIGLLGTFKYYDFFVDSFIEAFAMVGLTLNATALHVVLPVGISFYTFQTLGYTIDVYRGKVKPTKDAAAFFAFVSFFPQLVAGPIERASNLLPQFSRKRTIEYEGLKDGSKQILWGLFKKIVIADSCAIYVNDIFSNYEKYSGSVLWLGALFFAFQIYCDFSGYSDIAIGTARLFGFSLMRNFAYPYFSRDIAEFWRRWHISLSTWFRDYVYIPLGGSRGPLSATARNIIVIFVVSGLWHGANWTFVAWGALNAAYILPLMLLRRNRAHLEPSSRQSVLPGAKESLQMLFTFVLVLIGWVFFRSESISDAIGYLGGMFSLSAFSLPEKAGFLPLIAVFVVWELLQRKKLHGLQMERFGTFSRWIVYAVLIIAILSYWGNEQAFVYFQF